MDQRRKPDVFRFILNPRAGRKDGSYLTGQIESVFASLPDAPDCQIILTERPGHATRLAADFAALYGSRLMVVACGGDGTAREVAAGLVDTEAAMSILPIGTANDFARVALSTRDVDLLIPLLPYPCIRPIDLIAVDDEVSLNITSLGFDTKVQLKAMQLNTRFRFLGSSVYPLAIVLSLIGKRQYALRCILDIIDQEGLPKEITLQTNMILAAVCNGRYYGGGYNPAPTASLDDGQLVFSMVENMPLRRIMTLLPKYKKGTHLEDQAVHTWSVRSGEIEALDGVLLGNYDGDAFQKKRIHFRVLPGALNFGFC